MERNFENALFMGCSRIQFEQDLKEQLVAVGYKCVGEVKNGITNKTNKTNGIIYPATFTQIRKTKRFVIEEYNPKLFVALAAMSQGDEFQTGEWLVCLEQNLPYLHKGGFYKFLNTSQRFSFYIDIEQDDRGIRGDYVKSYFRKANKEELINHFSSKVDVKQTETINYWQPKYEVKFIVSAAVKYSDYDNSKIKEITKANDEILSYFVNNKFYFPIEPKIGLKFSLFSFASDGLSKKTLYYLRGVDPLTIKDLIVHNGSVTIFCSDYSEEKQTHD